MKVKFLPQDVEFEIKPGQSVMSLAHEHGLPIRSSCNGIPSCSECRVRVTDGEWNLTPPSRKEQSLIGTGYFIDQRRLSCQLICFGDITVDLTEQLEKAAEGPVTKKFLTKVHKSSIEETHSVSGVLIEQDQDLIQSIKVEVGAGTGESEPRHDRKHRSRGGGGGGGRRPQGGPGQGQGQQGQQGKPNAAGGGTNGGGGGGRKRRRFRPRNNQK